MGLNYEKSGDVIEIIVRDATMHKVGTWKFNAADIELGSGILSYIQKKYGFSPTIKPQESVGELNKKAGKPIDKDDWVNLDVKW